MCAFVCISTYCRSRCGLRLNFSFFFFLSLFSAPSHFLLVCLSPLPFIVETTMSAAAAASSSSSSGAVPSVVASSSPLAADLFLHHLTLQPSSLFTLVVGGNFSAPRVQEIVGVSGGGQWLSLLRPNEHTGRVETVHRTNVFGVVRSIQPFRLVGQ